MKLEDQVCSLELAKKLKELGVKQDSYYCWNLYIPSGVSKLESYPATNVHYWQTFSAFTVAELGEILPPFVTTEKYLCKGKPRFNAHEEETIECHSWHDDKEANARAKMLIHLIEQGIVKP